MTSCGRRFIIFLLLIHGFAGAAESVDGKTVSDSNAFFRGNKLLYREGWFIVTSTEKTLSYAKEHALTSSGNAISRALAELDRHTVTYGGDLTAAGQNGMQAGKQVFDRGHALTLAELSVTGKVVQAEFDYGSAAMKEAWQHFIRGNMTLAQRTEDDRKALAAIPHNYFANLKSDFSNVYELAEKAEQAMSTHIEGHWSEAFGEAQAAFHESYERSGTRGNSMSGVGDLLVGYAKAAYSGLIKPAARSTVQGAEATAKVAGVIVFLPVASTLIWSTETVASAGLTLYYTVSTGIKLVSPTVEGGLLAGLSIFSYGAMPPTLAVGGAAGVVNEIAVRVTAPAAATGTAAVEGGGATAMYAARVSYDLLKGSTTVAMNQAQAGIALGYNALTAIPTQALLGTLDGAIFLGYEGTRLVIASAKGEVQWHDDAGAHGSVPVKSVPVGSVVDLNALSKEPGVQVQVISRDPEVIRQVLEKLPQDLREGGRQ